MSEKQFQDQSPSTNRIEAFSDGVFAIVITLLVLELRVPQIANEGNALELLNQLYLLLPKFLGFVMSFFFVAVFWVAHHQFFHTLNFSKRGLLWLNNLFLFFITFIAFPTAVLGSYPKNETAIIFFGASFFAASLTFAVLRWFGWRKNETASDEFADDSFRKAMQRSFLPPILYLVGMIIAPFSLIIAIIIYFLTPALLIIPLKLRTRSPKKDDLEV
jgi:uncharacterized membrane protein